MKKVTRIIYVMAFCLVAMMGMSNVSEAAKVGEALTAPEDGWQRIDDKDANIVYKGDWGIGNGVGHFNDAVHYNVSNQSSCTFKFYGTKVRLIVPTRSDFSNNVSVKLDGVETFYSSVSENFIIQRIVFERTDLNLGYHTLEIKNMTNVPMHIDAIDIDATRVTNLKATTSDKGVILDWNQSLVADSYVIKYGTSLSELTKTKAVSTGEYNNCIIDGLANGIKYYFTVSAIVNGVEKEASNVVFATPKLKSDYEGNSAILEVIMTNGTIKEYNLTNTELESFLTWYDNRADGIGKSYYRIPKKSNVKPFLSRKEYLSFDKIYSFEVKDYNE